MIEMTPIAELTSMGRASIKLRFLNGKVIYIDPYAGDDSFYTEPADLILVTHQHGDHNQVDKVAQKADTKIIQCPMDIHYGQSTEWAGIQVKAVAAYNKNHPKDACCGYLVTYNGLTLYHSGDTSLIDEMKALKQYHIHYALLCMDGYYNMGPNEAMSVAETITPDYVIPIHTSKEKLYNADNDDAFLMENKVSIMPGEKITLYI